MKSNSVILKVVISVAAIVAIISSVVLARGLIEKHRIATRKPILKVMSMSSVGWITPRKPHSVSRSGIMVSRKNHYYTVYDNGDYEEVNQFELSDIDTYDLGVYNEGSFLTETERNNLKNYPSCTDAIVEYAKQLDHSLLNRLYVTDGRYFFDIHDSKSNSKYTSTIYEYFPDSNSVKKLVQFKDYDTEHVELY